MEMMELARNSLSQLLEQVCEALQLTETQHDSAVEKYTAVGNWIGGPGSPLDSLATAIYPQGSMALGTTVRPFDDGEYDLDLIFEVTRAQLSPADLHRVIERRLRDNQLYSVRLVSPCPPRCIRLAYAGDFHLDIVPARTALLVGGTAIEVPDRELKCWIPNDPKGYAKWFENSCGESGLMQKATPQDVPSRVPSGQKPPLKRAVQLWKRQRDIVFGDAKGAPSSIFLTTLAGTFYKGEALTANALSNILVHTELSIRTEWPNRISVTNPTNAAEDLCNRFSDDEYAAFAKWVGSFNQAIQKLIQTQGLEKIASVLEILFGESLTSKVVKSFMERLALDQQSGRLRYQRSGLITGAAAVAVPRHTFHGDE
jgi:hypothetical protein